jgi:hypothetical protein
VRCLTVLSRAASRSTVVHATARAALDERLPHLVRRAPDREDLAAALSVAVAELEPVVGTAVAHGNVPIVSVAAGLLAERIGELALSGPPRRAATDPEVRDLQQPRRRRPWRHHTREPRQAARNHDRGLRLALPGATAELRGVTSTRPYRTGFCGSPRVGCYASTLDGSTCCARPTPHLTSEDIALGYKLPLGIGMRTVTTLAYSFVREGVSLRSGVPVGSRISWAATRT